MARFWFGGDLPSFSYTTHDLGGGTLVARVDLVDVPHTFWTAITGGTQYTDLLNSGGGAVTTITPANTGVWPLFQGPDGITLMAADGGAGRRWVRTWQDLAGPAGAAGAQGVAGPQGTGEPVFYWDGAATWYEVPDPITGARVTANRGKYANATVVKWSGNQQPAFGAGSQQARDDAASGWGGGGDLWRRTP